MNQPKNGNGSIAVSRIRAIFASFCADPSLAVAGRVGSPSRPDCGEVVGSGVANVDGPLGDRTLYQKPPTRPKRRLLGKEVAPPNCFSFLGRHEHEHDDAARKNIDNYFFEFATKQLISVGIRQRISAMKRSPST